MAHRNKNQLWRALMSISAVFFVVISCDSIPEDYYIFDNNKFGQEEIYFIWSDSARCGTTIKNDSLEFNSVDLVFPKDNSVVQSYSEYYFDYRFDSLDVVVDSVEKCSYFFKIDEKDPRIKKNSFVYLKLKHDGKTVLFDTLFREKVERSVLDLIPLPRHM